MSNIVIYTLPNCPKCMVLKKKLEQKGISYTAITDVEVLKSKGIENVPVMEISSGLMDFIDAVEWVKNAEVQD